MRQNYFDLKLLIDSKSNNFLKGKKILENDINLLRPGNGINPTSILNFVNKKLRRNVKKDSNLNKNDFKKK